MNLRLASWDRDRDALVAIRRSVFMDEQGVPEDLEWDGLDPTAIHFLAIAPSGESIGTVRFVESRDGELHLGRMAVLRSWRGHGVGTALLHRALDWARARGTRLIRLNAQLTALPFYLHNGFVAVGAPFSDAGIPHRAMQRYL